MSVRDEFADMPIPVGVRGRAWGPDAHTLTEARQMLRHSQVSELRYRRVPILIDGQPGSVLLPWVHIHPGTTIVDAPPLVVLNDITCYWESEVERLEREELLALGRQLGMACADLVESSGGSLEEARIVLEDAIRQDRELEREALLRATGHPDETAPGSSGPE